MSQILTENITTRTINLKNMVCNCCIKIIQLELENVGVKVEKALLGEITIVYDTKAIKYSEIEEIIFENGFEVITDKDKILAEQIKIAVIELIHYAGNKSSIIRNSDYLVEKLGYSYQYLTSVFTSIENTTLEKFIILHKIEKVKELLEYGELSLSEIAYQMEYSSVQYLSTQFKNITGVSVTDYKRSGLSRKPLDKIGDL
jgi:AraC-like DNA-binding protein